MADEGIAQIDDTAREFTRAEIVTIVDTLERLSRTDRAALVLRLMLRAVSYLFMDALADGSEWPSDYGLHGRVSMSSRSKLAKFFLKLPHLIEFSDKVINSKYSVKSRFVLSGRNTRVIDLETGKDKIQMRSGFSRAPILELIYWPSGFPSSNAGELLGHTGRCALVRGLLNDIKSLSQGTFTDVNSNPL